MRELVADIRSYPDFIKWIRFLRVETESADGDVWTGRALAGVGFKGFSERFTTDVTVDKATNDIDVTLVRGPFRKLKNDWRFHPMAEGCRIEFDIDFEFSNFILNKLLEANFELAVKRLMTAFLDEANRRFAHDGFN